MKRRYRNESGAVMIEGMLVVVITLIVLVWLLALCFLYYQKYTVRVVTNDAAVKVAATYFNPESDIIMGFIDTTDMRYRSLNTWGGDNDTNEARAEAYVKYILNKANFSGVVDDVTADLELVRDSLGRCHVKLTTSCTLNTPFGFVLDFLGMGEKHSYTVTSYAEATYLTNYISTVEFVDTLTDGTFLAGTKFTENVFKFIDKSIEEIGKLVDLMNGN